MKALSIRQPWAWLIVNGIKDIENRDWPTRFRGEFLIHASKGCTVDEYDDCRDLRHAIHLKHTPDVPYINIPPLTEIERGGIVGIATLVDCVEESDSPWFFGRHGFVLKDIRPLPFRPYKGALGFFDVIPSSIAAQ